MAARTRVGRAKKTAPEEIPRGGVIFLVRAHPVIRESHEINQGYGQPGGCNGDSRKHDLVLLLPLEAAVSARSY